MGTQDVRCGGTAVRRPRELDLPALAGHLQRSTFYSGQEKRDRCNVWEAGALGTLKKAFSARNRGGRRRAEKIADAAINER